MKIEKEKKKKIKFIMGWFLPSFIFFLCMCVCVCVCVWFWLEMRENQSSLT